MHKRLIAIADLCFVYHYEITKQVDSVMKLKELVKIDILRSQNFRNLQQEFSVRNG